MNRRSHARSGTARLFLAASIILASSLGTSRAEARRFFRARFRTESLELEKPGELEIDTEVGGFYGDGPDGSRLLVPYLEVDVGITRWLELDFMAALTVTELTTGAQWAGNPLWLAARVDAYGWTSKETGARFGIGLQLGPRFPSLHTPVGVGFAALGLVGGGTRHLSVVGNLGTLLDYGHDPGLMFGVDAQYELSDDLSLLGNVAAVHYLGRDSDQALLGIGAGYKLNDHLLLALLAVGGPFVEGDRAGALLAVSYTVQAWGQKQQGGGSPQSPQVN